MSSSEEYQQVLRYLSRPESYPHRPSEVEHIQTHISHVFIAGPYVYKIKKPVNFGFLDYSTLSNRKEYCHREIELNRRLSDGVYIRVEAICRKAGELVMQQDEPACESVVEYAVKMKKLSPDYFLHNYIKENLLTQRQLIRVADKLANFYLSQDPDEEVLEWGKIEKIRVNTDENFQQVKPYVGELIDEISYNAIKKYTNSYYEKYDTLFQRRIDNRRIVDGHGDLHLEHIHVTPQEVQIYDCIEFNDRFRYGDWAADLAYFAMDLDFHNKPAAEHFFVSLMCDRLEDRELHNVINFYKCYRAFVKGKVKSLQSSEEEVPEEERKRAREMAARYFKLSLKYALLGTDPGVFVFMGGVGGGKSTLARQMSERLNVDRFSSDHIRKTMANLPLNQRTPREKREELYSGAMSDKTYQQLQDAALRKLGNHRNVILDATYSSRERRQPVVNLLSNLGANYYFIEVSAPEEVIRERLKERSTGNADVISDARLEDYEMLSGSYDPPEEIHPDRLICLNTDKPMEETLLELYYTLLERNM